MSIHIMPPFFEVVKGVEHTLTVYPDAHPEITSVDGWAGHQLTLGSGLPWTDLLDAAGNVCDDIDTMATLFWVAYDKNTVNAFRYMGRGIFLFDTSSIPSGAHIDLATLTLVGEFKKDELSILPNLNVYTSSPASNTVLANSDYATLGVVALCNTPISYNDFNIDSENIFTLNGAGRNAIAKGGITKLGMRSPYYDVYRNAPPWIAGSTFITAYTADKGGTNRPKLTVTYRI